MSWFPRIMKRAEHRSSQKRRSTECVKALEGVPNPAELMRLVRIVTVELRVLNPLRAAMLERALGERRDPPR